MQGGVGVLQGRGLGGCCPLRRRDAYRRAVLRNTRYKRASWLALACACALTATSCGGASGGAKSASAAGTPQSAGTSQASTSPTTSHADPTSTSSSSTTSTTAPVPAITPLRAPASVTPIGGAGVQGQGVWSPAGRTVGGNPAIYETNLVPPGGSTAAGVAWMDTRLLSARLYSGSLSPGGGPYIFTAPVLPAQAASLVAAFNGGFMMSVAHGGYYTEGKVIDPLVTGAASLVIYSDGSVNVGAWGSDVSMTSNVVAVRQNLVPLVANGQPTALASTPYWLDWGATCGVNTCVGAGIENQWRSGLGITADGALVYVTGPSLAPLQLAQLLVAAGAIRGMQLDINPNWTVLATYNPPPGGLASPANGSKLVASTVQGPATFFEAAWARDFVTMSARIATAG